MKKQQEISRPRRERHPIPKDLKDTLVKKRLWNAYLARPPYQRNDYVGWITGAKLAATRAKRTQQMLDELVQGALYMKMKWNPR